MAGAKQISCILCLCAYEPAGMIDIALPHHAFLPDAAVRLCQECCAAVLETCVKRHEEAPPSWTKEKVADIAGALNTSTSGERE